MKEAYKEPVMEVYEFAVEETIMDGGCSAGFDCPDGICIVHSSQS